MNQTNKIKQIRRFKWTFLKNNEMKFIKQLSSHIWTQFGLPVGWMKQSPIASPNFWTPKELFSKLKFLETSEL